MWLLAERELGAESAVSGYIAYLPQPGCASFYDAPLHWAEEELRELQYPPMIGAVYEQREQIKGLHARLRQGGGARAAAVTLEQVTWLGLGLGLRLGLGLGVALAAPRATSGTLDLGGAGRLYLRGISARSPQISPHLEQVTWAEQVVWSRAFASTRAKVRALTLTLTLTLIPNPNPNPNS